jgi:hypothetical protein
MKVGYVLVGVMVGGAILAGHAQTTSLGLTLPSSSSGYGQDSISSGGFSCSQSVDGATKIETGIVRTQQDQKNSGAVTTNAPNAQTGLYARIVIPIDKPKARIDCNELYQLELMRRRLELRELQADAKDRQADRELKAQERAQRKREIAPTGGFETVPLE